MSFKRHKAITALPETGERNLCIAIDFVEAYTGGNPECYTLHAQAINHLTSEVAKGSLTAIKRDKEELIRRALQMVEEELRIILNAQG